MKGMKLFKRGKYWYVQISRGKKISLRTTDKREALKAFNEIKKAALLKKLIQFEKTITLEQFVDKY